MHPPTVFAAWALVAVVVVVVAVVEALLETLLEALLLPLPVGRPERFRIFRFGRFASD